MMRIALPTTLFLGAALMTNLSAAPPEGLVPSITVVGTGEVRAKPDTAQINVGVVTEAPTAAEAVQSNSKAMEQLLQTIKQQGIEEKYIQTSGFNVSPKYHYQPRGDGGTPEIVGYTVSNQVQVTARDLSSLGEVLDKVVRAGANQIHGISFSIHDPTETMDEARRNAMKDARRKAELYAELIGAELGRPILVQETSPDMPEPLMRGGMRMAAAEMAVPIATGEQTLSASITVTYALKQDGNGD